MADENNSGTMDEDAAPALTPLPPLVAMMTRRVVRLNGWPPLPIWSRFLCAFLFCFLP